MLLMSIAMARPGLRSEVLGFESNINGDNLWDFCNLGRGESPLVEEIIFEYRIIVSAITIFIGLLLCFFGKKSVKVAFRACTHTSSTCSSADFSLEAFPR